MTTADYTASPLKNLPSAALPTAALRESVTQQFPSTVEELIQLVAIPGIAWDAFDPAALESSAAAVASLLRSTGLEDVRILRVPKADGGTGGPAVVARKTAAPGMPTVVLYAHHDVQPPGDKQLWDSEPFKAQERHGRLYGRGAADDKAGIMAHIASFRAVMDTLGPDFGVGVTFFIEGEEEAGSPTFADFLAEYRELLAGDVIIVADSANWQVGIPALTTSLRGLVDGIVEVRVASHAVHSGMFGGPLLDAPTILSRLIATFHDAHGSVAIKGLRGSEETTVDYTEEAFRADAGVLDGVQLAGTGSITEALSAICPGQCPLRCAGHLHPRRGRAAFRHRHRRTRSAGRTVGHGRGVGCTRGGNRHGRFHSVHCRSEGELPGGANSCHWSGGSGLPRT